MIGLNDTLSFATNADQEKLTGMSVEIKDLKYLAGFERNPRKKRLMQEKQFDRFAGSAVLSSMYQGPRAEFVKDSYDSLGEPVKTAVEVEAEKTK